MSKAKDDESLDIIEGLPVEDEEGPTRSLGAPPDGDVEAQDRLFRSAPPSLEILVASEEALRVFDEMSSTGSELSNPGDYPVRFGGHGQEESRIQTLPPHPPGGGSTIEISFDDVLADGAEDMSLPTVPGVLSTAGGGSGAALREGWLVFEHCPCPLFRLDSKGCIQVANGALCRFLGATLDALRGLPLERTRLGRIDPTLVEEIDDCIVSRSALQRIVSFQASGSQVVRFLLWIIPFSLSGTRGQSFAGIILPYPGQGQ